MPVEVIDLISSPDLPRPAARIATTARKVPLPLAKALSYEPPKSANQDWCILFSDDISSGLPAPKPISSISAKPKSNVTTSTKAPQSTNTSKNSNDFFVLTDDFDTTVNLDDPLNSDSPAAKKRRLSTSPKASRLPEYKRSISNMETSTKSGRAKTVVGKGHSYRSSMSNVEASTKPAESRTSTDGPRRPKTIKPALVSDPIVFTSSPDPFADAARWRRERKKDIWEQSDEEDIFDHMPSNKDQGQGSADGTGVLKSRDSDTLNDFTLNNSSDVDLPDLKTLPYKSSTKTSSKGRSALSVLEKYNAQKAAEKKAKEKAENAKEKLSSKEAEKERKRLAKEERARQKESAAEVAKVNTLRTDKKVSTPEMIVDFSSSLEFMLADQVRSFLGPLQVAHSRWECTLPLIKWRRNVVAEYDDEIGYWKPTAAHIKREKHVMCVMPAKEFVDLATGEEGKDLDAHVVGLKAKFESCEIIYLIEGLATWMKRNKNVKNRKFDREVRSQIPQEETGASQRRKKKRKEPEYIDEDMVEDALLRLQVIHVVLIHHTSTMIETAEWIVVFTQHISTIPYRTKQQSLDTAFCMESGQVKAGDGPADTFIKMLQEILRVTAPIAYGIVAQYPTVQKLVKGLEENGPLALEDFKKTANKDGAFTDRRVGPSISKRVYNVFMGRDAGSWDV